MNDPRFECRVFLTMDRGVLFDRRVAARTGGDYCHCGLQFRLEKDVVYFESTWLKDEGATKNGVRGPLAWRRLTEWRDKDPTNRWISVEPQPGPLPLTPEEVDAAFRRCCQAVRDVRYDPGQIGRNLFTLLTHLIVYRNAGSPNDWTCSEMVVRCLPPRLWPCFQIPDYTADYIAPSGNKLPSIRDGIVRVMAKQSAELAFADTLKEMR